MKMNWGKYLVIGMGLFMAFIVSMGIFMLSRTKDEYDSHYYEKGLDYDTDYQRKQQVEKDHARPLVKVTDGLVINFTRPATGKATLQRPADRKLDRVYAIQSRGQDQWVLIPQGDLLAGQWQMRLEWESGGQNYLYEREVIMP